MDGNNPYLAAFPKRDTVYDDDDDESDASGLDKEMTPEVLYHNSKEQSSVSSADVTPSRSKLEAIPDRMLMPMGQCAMLELSDDQKNIFNMVNVSNAVVETAMRSLQESISEEKRIRDLANSANQG